MWSCLHSIMSGCVLFFFSILCRSDMKALFKRDADTSQKKWHFCFSVHIKWTLRRPKMADVNKCFLCNIWEKIRTDERGSVFLRHATAHLMCELVKTYFTYPGGVIFREIKMWNIKKKCQVSDRRAPHDWKVTLTSCGFMRVNLNLKYLISALWRCFSSVWHRILRSKVSG